MTVQRISEEIVPQNTTRPTSTGNEREIISIHSKLLAFIERRHQPKKEKTATSIRRKNKKPRKTGARCKQPFTLHRRLLPIFFELVFFRFIVRNAFSGRNASSENWNGGNEIREIYLKSASLMRNIVKR